MNHSAVAADLVAESIEDGQPAAASFPKEGVRLSWDVSFAVPRPMAAGVKGGEDGEPTSEGEKIDILRNVKGSLSPGQLMACIGPSGSGKSSLLNILSMRNSNFSGRVLYNGKAVKPGAAARMGAFVQQEDMFMPTLTPLECVKFKARLTSAGRQQSVEEMNARIDHVIKELGLTKAANTLIGGQGSMIKGISGGERKRLSIALELLTDPPILFLDEPTSGLDSYMAQNVVEMLKRLCVGDGGDGSKRSVLCSIHQPASDVFSTFTHLMVLAAGRTVYSGPMPEASTYFASIGNPYPQFYNPSDFLMKLVSGNNGADMKRLADQWDDSPQGMAAAAHEEEDPYLTQLEAGGGGGGGGTLGASGRSQHSDSEALTVTSRQASWPKQLKELVWRNGLMTKRDPVLTRVRMAQAVIIGVVGGLIFLGVGNEPIQQSDVQSLVGGLFFLLLSQVVTGVIGLLQTFPHERPVMLREYGGGLYAVPPYFAARTIVELPVQIASPFIQATLFYLFLRLPYDGELYFKVLLAVLSTSFASFSLGYTAACLAPSPQIAVSLGPMFLMPMILFGGLLINIDDIPKYFYPISYLSMVRYGYGALQSVVWSSVDMSCPAVGPCSFRNGEEVLDFYHFKPTSDFYWRYIGINFCLMVGFRLLASAILTVRARRTVQRGGGYV